MSSGFLNKARSYLRSAKILHDATEYSASIECSYLAATFLMKAWLSSEELDRLSSKSLKNKPKDQRVFQWMAEHAELLIGQIPPDVKAMLNNFDAVRDVAIYKNEVHSKDSSDDAIFLTNWMLNNLIEEIQEEQFDPNSIIFEMSADLKSL